MGLRPEAIEAAPLLAIEDLEIGMPVTIDFRRVDDDLHTQLVARGPRFESDQLPAAPGVTDCMTVLRSKPARWA